MRKSTEELIQELFDEMYADALKATPVLGQKAPSAGTKAKTKRVFNRSEWENAKASDF